MKSLGNRQFYSHMSTDEIDRHTSNEVRHSNPKSLQSYSKLVEELAKIAYYNAGYSFFFRGQTDDFSTLYSTTRSRKATSIYPTIFRNKGKKLNSSELRERYLKLAFATEKLIGEFKNEGFTSYKRMRKFPELAWSVLQHYEVCLTPLADVTHSARVASSFALPENKQNALGYFYVFALPHPNEDIGYSVDNELVTLKLLNVCPPEAKRPFFQEGYLVGSFPYHAKTKRPEYDLAVRLIAKYKLVGRKFWSPEFPSIPPASLSPARDKVKNICRRVRDNIDSSL